MILDTVSSTEPSPWLINCSGFQPWGWCWNVAGHESNCNSSWAIIRPLAHICDRSSIPWLTDKPPWDALTQQSTQLPQPLDSTSGLHQVSSFYVTVCLESLSTFLKIALVDNSVYSVTCCCTGPWNSRWPESVPGLWPPLMLTSLWDERCMWAITQTHHCPPLKTVNPKEPASHLDRKERASKMCNFKKYETPKYMSQGWEDGLFSQWAVHMHTLEVLPRMQLLTAPVKIIF